MSGTATALLDKESSSIQKPLRPSYRATLLQNKENEVLSAEIVYAYFDQRDSTDKLKRLRECRTGAYFYRNQDTGQIRVGAQSCHLRFCPLCSTSRIMVIKDKTTDWLKSAIFPKIITFTLKHTDDPLRDQLNKLYDSFREIRRSSLLKNKCSGGVWFFQIKKSKSDDLWHPHIHCVVSGSYISQSKLAQKWYHITGDSKIVDIRMIKDIATAARHVSRYAARPSSLVSLSIDDCIEVAEALAARRLCGTWGVCRKLKLTSMPVYDHSKWEKVASWYCVIINKDIDSSAGAIFKAWKTGKSLDKSINMEHFFEQLQDRISEQAHSPPPIEYLPFY